MSSYRSLINKQKAFFQTGKTKEISFRIQALEQLRETIRTNEKQIIDALKLDLNKSEFDAYTTEIGYVLAEIRFILKRIQKWAKPKKVITPMTHFGAKSFLYPEPYGVALIISPWNYPFQLAIAPLIGAIAAGNCAIIKPSEFTPNTSNLLHEMIANIYPEEFVSVVEGDAKTSGSLLQEKVDYIFFTGSVAVGKIVMEKAAKNLTPVTLELGGKSPCIVHKDANMKLAAKRIAWGKFTNAGQTCVAPDYVYVHKEVKDEFLQNLRNAMSELYNIEPLQNEKMTKIVNVQHFDRLQAFLTDGEIFFGGKTNRDTLTIEPTILLDVTWDDAIMQDEIFGPILPILQYDNLSEVIDGIHNHPNPLALYLFTEDKNIVEEVLAKVAFGGGCINDTIYHLATFYLPFGGVGSSGIGSYHGKASFDTFTHYKSILKQTTRFDIPFRYPNVKNGLKKIKYFLK